MRVRACARVRAIIFLNYRTQRTQIKENIYKYKGFGGYVVRVRCEMDRTRCTRNFLCIFVSFYVNL